jgi:hypothetical protein
LIGPSYRVAQKKKTSRKVKHSFSSNQERP